MHRRSIPAIAAICGAVLAGCGGGAHPTPTTSKPTFTDEARAPGEIVISAEGAPTERGPYTFSGRYRVRFEQRDPELPGRDFTDQTAFVATLRPPDGPGRTIELFSVAGRRGDRTLRIDGRYVVTVEFGDFPYVLRLTPALPGTAARAAP